MLSPDLDELNVFLSHSCHNHDEIKKIAKFLESHGIICWKDLTEIRSGQRIHDRISAGLDQADCLIVLITKESVNSDEVLEEVLRARLRSKRIFYLIDSSRSRTDVSRLFSRGAWEDNPNTEDMTNTDDVSNIIEYGERSAALARLLRELNWLRHSKSFIQISQSNRSLHRMIWKIQASQAEMDFKRALVEKLVAGMHEEVENVARGGYFATIGLDKTYLDRARKLFEVAERRYVVSLSAVSRFWTNTQSDIAASVREYIAAQSSDTIRLFVFSDREAARCHRDMLKLHYDQYGVSKGTVTRSSGAVLICSVETYAHLLSEIVTHRDHVDTLLQQDFALLEYVDRRRRGHSSFEVLLSTTHLQLREVTAGRYGAIDHRRLRTYPARPQPRRRRPSTPSLTPWKRS